MALQRRDSSSPSPSISAATPSMPLSPYSLPSPKTPEMSCQPEKQQTFVRVQVAPDALIQSLSLLVLGSFLCCVVGLFISRLPQSGSMNL